MRGWMFEPKDMKLDCGYLGDRPVRFQAIITRTPSCGYHVKIVRVEIFMERSEWMDVGPEFLMAGDGQEYWEDEIRRDYLKFIDAKGSEDYDRVELP